MKRSPFTLTAPSCWSTPLTSSTCAEPHASDAEMFEGEHVSAASLHTALSDGVMLVMTPDSSGSMVKTVQALAKAEIEQIKRSLRPGDLYARIPFNATARVAILQQSHEPADLKLIAGVVSQSSVAAGRTALSSGLIAAR